MGNKELFIPNEDGLIPSLSTFLLQEMERFNKLLEKIVSSLKQLSNAIQGLGLMSEELDNIYYNLLNNKVPGTWEEYAYLSLKPLGSWVKDLKERVKILEEWLLNGNPNCYWISGFFFPQGNVLFYLCFFFVF
jgi:dynein heavy chain, axonemal